MRKICLDDQWHQIEYKSLYIICINCGCYDHYHGQCTMSKPAKPKSIMPESIERIMLYAHGDWLTVTRKKGAKSYAVPITGFRGQISVFKFGRIWHWRWGTVTTTIMLKVLLVKRKMTFYIIYHVRVFTFLSLILFFKL